MIPWTPPDSEALGFGIGDFFVWGRGWGLVRLGARVRVCWDNMTAEGWVVWVEGCRGNIRGD